MLSEEKIRELVLVTLAKVNQPTCACGCEDDTRYHYASQLEAYAKVLEETIEIPDIVRREESN